MQAMQNHQMSRCSMNPIDLLEIPGQLQPKFFQNLIQHLYYTWNESAEKKQLLLL